MKFIQLSGKGFSYTDAIVISEAYILFSSIVK